MSSVLRMTEGPAHEHVSIKPIMSRASNKGVVAGRVVVAAPAQSLAVPLPVMTLPAGSVAGMLPRERLIDGLEGEESRAQAAEPVGSFSREVAPAERPAGQRDDAERRLERRIRAHLTRGELSVTLTDNRYTMISVRRENKGVKHFKVRLHHMFAEAGPTITRALARYVAYNDREASRVLGEFIDSNQHRVRSRSRKPVMQRMITRGKVHDLQEIFDDLNRRYFGATIDARITWGQKVGKPRRRNSIKMGSYSVEEKLIRIHRSLDRAFVPRFFVEWVVYHEMLHQVHDIKTINGRRQFHSREFLRDEAKFEHYAAARSWERAHLDALLTY